MIAALVGLPLMVDEEEAERRIRACQERIQQLPGSVLLSLFESIYGHPAGSGEGSPYAVAADLGRLRTTLQGTAEKLLGGKIPNSTVVTRGCELFAVVVAGSNTEEFDLVVALERHGVLVTPEERVSGHLLSIQAGIDLLTEGRSRLAEKVVAAGAELCGRPWYSRTDR